MATLAIALSGRETRLVLYAPTTMISGKTNRMVSASTSLRRE